MAETVEAMAELLRPNGPEVDELLTELGERAWRIAPEIVGLSLGLAKEGITFTLISSDTRLATLDATQYLDGGPCVEVTEARQDVVEFAMDDPLHEGRWLLFAQASAAIGVASSLSLPIFEDGRLVGGINLYASTPDAFAGHHDELANALSACAAGAVTHADLSFSTRLEAAQAPAHLRAAQDIETATGVLAARLGQDLDAAGASLRHAAARAGVGLAMVARLIIMVHSGRSAPS